MPLATRKKLTTEEWDTFDSCLLFTYCVTSSGVNDGALLAYGWQGMLVWQRNA